MLTPPELTRLRASQPSVVLAGMLRRVEVEFAQVSRGSELPFKPCLNIIVGVHPRGLSPVIGMDEPALAIALLLMVLELGLILAMDMNILAAELSITLLCIMMLGLGLIPAIGMDMLPESLAVGPLFIMMLGLGLIPAMDTDMLPVSLTIGPLFIIVLKLGVSIADDGDSPRLVPASRIGCGRHSTFPSPFAKILSTQNGNAPVW